MDKASIKKIIVDSMKNLNLSRGPDEQIDESPDARLLGGESNLDSLGLVTLLIDIEDNLADHGCQVSLMDEKAMSRNRSPFRSVESLTQYIADLVESR